MKIISLNNLTVDEDRQRKTFSHLELAELEDSIFSHGLINPLMVRPDPEIKNSYILVAGERRLRAIKSRGGGFRFGDIDVPAGSVPVIVKNFVDLTDAGLIELHENIMRMDLTWQEKVAAIKKLDETAKERGLPNVEGEVALALSPQGSTEPTSGGYRQANKARAVAGFLDDPEVTKASTLSEAARIASRKIEQQMIEKLSKMDIKETPDIEPEKVDGPTERRVVSPPARPLVGTLYHGDCREWITKIPTASIDTVLADPPYGMNADKFKDGGHTTTLEHTYEDSPEYAIMVTAALVQELDRICKDHSHVYMFCRPEGFEHIKELFSDQWKVRSRPLIWSKGNRGKLGEGLLSGYSFCYECILVATRGGKPFAGVVPDVIPVPVVNPDIKVHGAQKPVELYKILLGQSNIPHDTVLDPFCGSGTIFPAARDLSMKPIGIELDEAMVAQAKERQR